MVVRIASSVDKSTTNALELSANEPPVYCY
jgi:hypothetical protein